MADVGGVMQIEPTNFELRTKELQNKVLVQILLEMCVSSRINKHCYLLLSPRCCVVFGLFNVEIIKT